MINVNNNPIDEFYLLDCFYQVKGHYCSNWIIPQTFAPDILYGNQAVRTGYSIFQSSRQHFNGKEKSDAVKSPSKSRLWEKNRCSDEMHAGDSLQNAVNVKDSDNHFGRNAKTYKCFFSLHSLDWETRERAVFFPQDQWKAQIFKVEIRVLFWECFKTMKSKKFCY